MSVRCGVHVLWRGGGEEDLVLRTGAMGSGFEGREVVDGEGFVPIYVIIREKVACSQDYIQSDLVGFSGMDLKLP